MGPLRRAFLFSDGIIGDLRRSEAICGYLMTRVKLSDSYLDKAARVFNDSGSLAQALLESGFVSQKRDVMGAIRQRRDAILRRAAELRREEADQWAASRSEAIRALVDIISADPAPILRGEPPETWPPGLRRAVQSVRLAGGDEGPTVVSATLADRVGALRTLLQAQGWLTERVEVTAVVGLADRLAKARAGAAVIDAESVEPTEPAQLPDSPDKSDKSA